MIAKRSFLGRRAGNILAGTMGVLMACAVAFFVLAIPSELFEALSFGSAGQGLVASCVGLVSGFATAAFLLPAERSSQAGQWSPTRPIFANDEFGQPSIEEPAPRTVALSPFPEGQVIFFPEPEAPKAENMAPEPVEDIEPTFVDLATLRGEAVPMKNVSPVPTEIPVIDAILEPTEPMSADKAVILVADDTVSGLMIRLENGLDTRARNGIPVGRPPRSAGKKAHLRDTLEELRRLASAR